MTSLTRVIEPEVMDSAEEARDYDAMDHTAVNRVFVVDFLAHWNGSVPMLDVDTGTVQIPIELCRQNARALVKRHRRSCSYAGPGPAQRSNCRFG
jgi:hypothetical protein